MSICVTLNNMKTSDRRQKLNLKSLNILLKILPFKSMQHNPGRKEKVRINVYVNDIPGACLEAKLYQRVFCKLLTRHCLAIISMPFLPSQFISCSSTSGVHTNHSVYGPSGSFMKGRDVLIQCYDFQKDSEIC